MCFFIIDLGERFFFNGFEEVVHHLVVSVTIDVDPEPFETFSGFVGIVHLVLDYLEHTVHEHRIELLLDHGGRAMRQSIVNIEYNNPHIRKKNKLYQTFHRLNQIATDFSERKHKKTYFHYMDEEVRALLLQKLAFILFLVTSVLTLIRGKWILALIPIVAGSAYYAMLSDKVHTERYRYMDWAVTTPLMLIALLSANGFQTGSISTAIGADMLMIYFGYKGTQQVTLGKKQLNFVISCAFFLPVLYFLNKCKHALNAKYLTILVWLLYPVVWYMNESKQWTNAMSTSIYAVMDVCAKVGLVYLLHA